IFIPGNITLGMHYLLVVADPSGQLTETDKGNNVRATPIVLVNNVDLSVTDSTAPASANLGDSVVLSWTTKNQGNATLTGTWSDSVYLSDDAIFSHDDTFVTTRQVSTGTTLAAGGAYTASQSVILPTTTTGQRYL